MKNKILFFLRFKKCDCHFIQFSNPVREIKCFKENLINDNLSLLDKYIIDGYFVAGFISYETGGVFNDLKLKNYKLPYLYFGIYEKPEIIKIKYPANNRERFVVYDLKDNIRFNEYEKKIKKIKNYLKNGETYQINYCFKKKFRFVGDAFALFLELLKNQTTKYSAFIEYEGYNILSLSPELFFKIDKNKIIMKPMKGTMIKNGEEKIDNIKDEKNIAENIMIVDLIRNDLGKICKTNSIKVPYKFTVEKYKTIYQMTSTITGELKDKIKFSDIIAALFPSGSVTGAPKRRSMQIIQSLEKEKRGVYTGSIGYFHKDRAMFNISIRTPVIDTKKIGEMGIGSGIVYDSDAKKEYRECQGKANFFTMLSEDFKVFESMLYIKGKGIFLLDQHLDRLEETCMDFGFKFNRFKVLNELVKFQKKIKDNKHHKIRIFIDVYGKIVIDSQMVEEQKNGLKLMVCNETTDSHNIFLRYKTTKREFYDRKLKEAKEKGFDEVVFFNERGEITECATSNIFILKDGIMYTPPIDCGLLNGTLRQVLLMKEPEKYKEKILYKEDLQNADGIFICNSVRGVRECWI